MTQHVEIHISGAIPEGDGFIGYAAVVAAQDQIDVVVETLAAKGIIDVKVTCNLVNRKRPKLPAASGGATFRAVPMGS